MPLMGTRGGASAAAYGLFSISKLLYPAGTLGLFQQGPAARGLNRYVFTNDTCTATTQYPNTTGNNTKTGFGIATHAILGFDSFTTGGNYKFIFNNNAIVSASSYTAAQARGASANNTTQAVIALGGANVGTSGTNTYTFAGDVVSAGGSLTSNLWFGASAGISTTALFSLGSQTTSFASGSNLTNKYSYASNTAIQATALKVVACGGPGIGNASIAIITIGFAGGKVNATTQKYTWAGDTTAAATNLTGNIGASSDASQVSQAAGNAINGIITIGTSGAMVNTCKYTYSNDVTSAAGALSLASRAGASASNGIPGVSA